MNDTQPNFAADAGGIYALAAQLVRWLDRPTMSIELLRQSMAAKVLRKHLRDFESVYLATRCVGIVSDRETEGLLAAGADAIATENGGAVTLHLDPEESAAVIAAGEVLAASGEGPYLDALKRVACRLNHVRGGGHEPVTD